QYISYIFLKVFKATSIFLDTFSFLAKFFFTRASFKQMCTMTFIIDNEQKYKWGFRISEKKAEEIKKH
ncbi:MAG: hypothetical protein ACFNPZ_05060, partial [Fusobacterium polymorphum]